MAAEQKLTSFTRPSGHTAGEAMNVLSTVTFSESKSSIFGALAKAQANMGKAFKDSVNPAFRSKFVSMASVLEAVLPSFNANGLAVLQHPVLEGVEMIHLTTVVTHESGEWMQSVCSMPVAGKRDAHAVGSAISYLRRYSLASIAGVIQSDDDGNAATDQAPQAPQQPAYNPRIVTAAPQQQAQAPQQAESEARATFVKTQPPISEQDVMNAEQIAQAIAPADYFTLAAYCAHHNKPAPDKMLAHQQRMMIDWVVNKNGAVAIQTWVDARKREQEAAEAAAEAAAVARRNEERFAAAEVENYRDAMESIPVGSEQAVMDALNRHGAAQALGAKATRARKAKATDGGVA
jgi:hypothetical protein